MDLPFFSSHYDMQSNFFLESLFGVRGLQVVITGGGSGLGELNLAANNSD